MSDQQDSDAIFVKPTVPKNTWQLLNWAIFQPKLVESYSETLSRKQALLVSVKCYPGIIVISALLYLLGSAVIVAGQLPLLFPEQFKPQITALFSGQHDVVDLYLSFISGTALRFVLDIAFGLVLVLAGGLAIGLAGGLAGGLVGGLAGGLVGELAYGLAYGLAVGLAVGLAYGLAGGLVGRQVFGLILGLILGLTGGLAVVFGFYLGYFRLIFYPFYCLAKMNFYSSPYHQDSVIWLPIWRARQRLCALALTAPETALKFVAFLRRYCPLQEKLADYISHAALSGFWLKRPLAVEVLTIPVIENSKLKPSDTWLRQLDQVKSQLIGFQQQSNIQLKQQHGLQLRKELETFKQQTLIENRSWRDYYLQAIECWLKVAAEQLEQLRLLALSHEPITANVYLSGDALNPELHKKIFFGRDDLKNQFAYKVQTAVQMPLFLIQGQRRTGKTSLLNFLEPLLGAGFRVVKQDLQDARFDSIPSWLADLQQRINPYLDAPLPELAGADWLQCWQIVQTGLSGFSGSNHFKLILAFDEYEAIHTLLQQDPGQGERLLAAMRSFSQQQNKVVFLFVGAALFSELESPNWSRYFVQVQRFRVDYLAHDEALRLITEPVELNYPPAVCEQLFALTQGHPALLQLLCSKLVDIANIEQRKDMTQADLDAVVRAVGNERETMAILIFWKDFCAEAECKQVVKRILNGEIVEASPHRHRLEEHGFIVEDNGHWKMRVPLFAQWLNRFADRV